MQRLAALVALAVGVEGADVDGQVDGRREFVVAVFNRAPGGSKGDVIG